jgi:putative membrane protein
VQASYPEELLLQHVPTVLGVLILAIAVWKFHPSTLSFVCCIGFLWLHLIGARWIYSFVPYDDIAVSLSGTSLSELFGWQRNHYDRLVHFASGFLGVPPFAQFLRALCETPPRASIVLAVACVLAVGAMYEVLEWQIAVTFSPEMAESYNGQQGDVWDPQKDLALAWLGAIVWFAWLPRASKITDIPG